MKFNLTKDLIFFDVESTGLNVVRDRIVQIALIKYSPGKDAPEELSLLINPGVPIPEESQAIHGISAADVANKPTFGQVAKQIYDFIGEGDLSGYNSARFDIPILMEEFARVGMEFSMENRSSVDVQRIFYKMEPRTLSAAMRYYCNKELEGAHDALSDVRATVEVLKGQLTKYDGVDMIADENETIPAPVVNDIKALHAFTSDLKTIDATQRLKYNKDGVIVFNFGKHANTPVVEVLRKDKNYYNWILTKDFSSQVKQIIKRIYKENVEA